MRKILFAALAVLCAVTATQAKHPTNACTNCNYIYTLDTVINSGTSVLDSLIGHATTIDSVTFLNNWSPKHPGWEYFLVLDTLITSADSCSLYVQITANSSTNEPLYVENVDTVLGTRAGSIIDLGVGTTCIGSTYDVRAKSMAATDRGSQIKFTRAYIYRRKAVVSESRWP